MADNVPVRDKSSDDANSLFRLASLAISDCIAPFIERDHTPDQIDRMCESFKSVGQLTEIVAVDHPTEPGKYLVVSGWTRYLAAVKAGFTHLRTKVLRHQDNAFLAMFSVTDNTSRNELPLIAQIKQVKLLKEVTGENDERIARKIGYAKTTVFRLSKMAGLEPTILDGIQEGLLAFDDATALTQVTDLTERMRLFEELKQGKIKRGKLKHFVTKPRHITSKTFHIAGASLRLPVDADALKFVKDFSRRLDDTLKAFKASGQDATTFLAWLESQQGGSHVDGNA